MSPARSSLPSGAEVNATPDLRRFLVLSVQLGLLALVFSLFNLENAGFGRLLAGVFVIFAVHYWTPFRFKEPLWILASMGGAFWLMDPLPAALVIATGFAFFLILRAPVAFVWRFTAIGAIFAVLAYSRVFTDRLPIPSAFYPVFGAIFMFRIVVYMYDLAHSKEPARLLPFLSYFLLLPNFYFTLFPIIDYKTMRRSFYQRDIHEIAQQGIQWMLRGTIQLILYRLVVYFKDPYLPDRVDTFPKLVLTMVLTYVAYINVSGQYHFIVGMLHLFGYDLPETNHKYLLARSFTDFWRRANIYWKDFMVKVVYFPVYFKLRRKGDKLAQAIAIIAVFAVTWACHWYQSFWLVGPTAMSVNDVLFYTILGLLVLCNMFMEPGVKQRKQAPTLRSRSIHVVQVLGTFTSITILWTFWSSPSLGAWYYLMTHWARSH